MYDMYAMCACCTPLESLHWCDLHGGVLSCVQVSTENAVLVTRGRRWPLMIDPQDQVCEYV